ncbi:MAG: cation-translocating P-type ATPase [Bacteroidota bacterium]|jgi:Ca2+-transporting ATPase|nr:cation-translocating P-type ATPase [Bacteroidota bacterium]
MKGLSTIQVNENLKKHGFNELPSAKPKNLFRIALEVLKEPMFLLLISCGIIYIVLGDYREGGVLLSTIFIIIFITFYQYQKTEKALSALKLLSSPRALVIRNGEKKRIAGREVVPDDILILNEGDRIAADGSLLETTNLMVDESMLTGESVPVLKSLQDNGSDTNGLVFSGTLIVQGNGVAKVMATGTKTQFGKIGISLQGVKEEGTRLQKEMKMLIRNLFIAGALISAGVVIVFYFTRGNFIQSLLNGLASAMAILPEEFPVVLTVFMAIGAWRLSKKNVLTRKPSAIESLGSATVLCSDKTGTITQNKMEIAAVFCGNELIYKDDFERNKNKTSGLITTAYFASQNNPIDPMEKAIEVSYQSMVSKKQPNAVLVKEYPLSKSLFAMTRVIKFEPENQSFIFCKGAPEAIFQLCKMDRIQISSLLSIVEQLGENGLRVIAAAKTSLLPGTSLPESQHGFDFEFEGLIALEDPIRPEVPQALKECEEAGIKVIMITGDFPATAKSIAHKIGMNAQGKILSGHEIKEMSDDELKNRILDVNVFARVVPEQKLRIVEALKANHEIVAMTGDGVNDAPALKAAHIGIAMGGKGTDVAREAASLVLLDDNFASIVAAIRSGRKIFDNLQKAMFYIIAVHIPIIGLALLPAFIPSLPLLLMPLHIVFMELIIDPVCSIAFESEQEEKGIMKRPPRNPEKKFFGLKNIFFSIAEGTLVLLMVMAVYFLSIYEGHTEGEVRAIAFSSLIVGNVFLILTNLSKTRSFIAVIAEKNIAVIVILIAAMFMLVSILSVPSLRIIFNFEFPGYKHFISSIIGSVSILAILETIKYFFQNRKSDAH